MRGTPVLFEGFVGGVNALDAPYLLKDTEARDPTRNVISSSRGAIKKRPGAVTFATPGVALTSLAASLNPNFLIGAGGTVVYSIAPNGAVTTIKTGMTNGARWEFVVAPANGGQGPIYGMNGTDNQQWDGIAATTSAWTAATGTLPAGAKYLVYHGLRVWAAGMAAYAGVPDPGSTVVFSNLGNPRDWPAANVVQFDPNDGEAITAIGTIGPYVLVAKPSKLWVIYDTNTGANRRVGENVGCVAHRSMVETPLGTFFLSKDQGVMLTNGSTARKAPNANNVKPYLDLMSGSLRSQAAAGYINDRYYLSFSQGGVQNDLTLDFDAKLDAWFVHTLAEQQYALWELSGVPWLFGAKPGAAVVDRCFVDGQTQDNGASYSSLWWGPFHAFGTPSLRKRVTAIHFDGKGKMAVLVAKAFAKQGQLLANADFTGTDGLFGTNDGGLFGANDGGIYGGLADVSEQKVLTPGVSRAWSLILGNSTADDFTIDSYTFWMRTRKN
jgi:hypothetical protein